MIPSINGQYYGFMNYNNGFVSFSQEVELYHYIMEEEKMAESNTHAKRAPRFRPDSNLFVGSLLIMGKRDKKQDFHTNGQQTELRFSDADSTCLYFFTQENNSVRADVLLAPYVKLITTTNVATLKFYINIQEGSKARKNQMQNKDLSTITTPIRMDIYLNEKIFDESSLIGGFHPNSKNNRCYEPMLAYHMLLYLIKKCNIKVLKKSLVVPPPKINLLMKDYRSETIGHKKKFASIDHHIRARISKWRQKFSRVGNYHSCINPQLLFKSNPNINIQQYYRNSSYKTHQWIPQIFDLENQLVNIQQTQSIYYKDQYVEDNSKESHLLESMKKKHLREIGAEMFIYDDYTLPTAEELENRKDNQKDDQEYENQVRRQNQDLLQEFQSENLCFDAHPIPSSLLTQLKTYQRQALTWMKMRQGKIPESLLFDPIYRHYKEGQFQRQLSMYLEQVQLPSGIKLYLNHLTGEIKRNFETSTKILGGILADQMGLGKTLMILSLMADENFQGTNLVVVPVSLLSQWQSQIQKHCGNIAVLNYNNWMKSGRNQINFRDYSVILVSYATLSSEYRSEIERRNQQNFFKFNFQRIILDEAHQIKDPKTYQYQAVSQVKAVYKWCLSGTIVQNVEKDIFSIFKFLGVQFFSDSRWWDHYIKNSTSYQSKLNILYTILRPIMLRRTKMQISLKLPQKIQSRIRLSFSPEEQRAYKLLQKGALEQIIQNFNGENSLYSFSIINKLRDFCCHPKLVIGNQDLKQLESNTIEQVIKQFFFPKIDQKFKTSAAEHAFDGAQSCPICLDNPSMKDLVVTRCGHYFCQDCINKWLHVNPRCSLCKTLLSNDDIMKVEVLQQDQKQFIEKHNLLSGISKKCTKMQKILELISEIKKRKEKCVIFTQKLGMITLLQEKFAQLGINFASIMGSMVSKKRESQIKMFKEDKKCLVMIVSMKAGGTGLNLQNANNVIICDPSWNPSQEEQAIGRVHRLGQDKRVNVYRLTMRESIEQKIEALHEKKKMVCQQVMMSKQSISQQNMNMLAELIQILRKM